MHIIASDLDVRDQGCCIAKLNDKSWMMSNPVTQKGFVTTHIMLTTVKARVLNKPHIHY